jgi:hydroxypyruvate reductase
LTQRHKESVHKMTQTSDLTAIWEAGVKAAQGISSVSAAITAHNIARPDHVIAVGKAAASMAAAAYLEYGKIPTTIVTKYGHLEDAPDHALILEAAHPVPDQASLAAGKALQQAVAQCPAGAHLLVLVSGGASALAEVLPNEMSLPDLAAKTKTLLASGQDIHAMNALRKEISLIKGGKLLANFKGAKVTTLAISDVEGDDLNVIGSGIGAAPADPAFDFTAHIVASNQIARTAAAAELDVAPLSNTETLYENVETLAPKIGAQLRASKAGIHIMGGEPTVILPPNPGLGGRNMALALMIAREISGTTGIRVLVAGTDGTDGPTDAAGALVDGTTWDDSGETALTTANAAPWLDAKGALFRSGPTGTNVMDLLIAECAG